MSDAPKNINQKLTIDEVKDENWFLSKRFAQVLFGTIFILLGVVGFMNWGFFGNFIFFCFAYAFGVLSLAVLGLIILWGIYLIVGKYIKLHFTILDHTLFFIGLVLLFLFIGLLISTSEYIARGLMISTFVSGYNSIVSSISSGNFAIISLAASTKAGGGFLGYLFASLFISGMGLKESGAYLFSVLFIIAGVVLCLRKFFAYIYRCIHKSLIKKKAVQAIKRAQENQKQAQEGEDRLKQHSYPTAGPNPFKVTQYHGQIVSDKPASILDSSNEKKVTDDIKEQDHSFFGFGRKEQDSDTILTGSASTSPMLKSYTGADTVVISEDNLERKTVNDMLPHIPDNSVPSAFKESAEGDLDQTAGISPSKSSVISSNVLQKDNIQAYDEQSESLSSSATQDDSICNNSQKAATVQTPQVRTFKADVFEKSSNNNQSTNPSANICDINAGLCQPQLAKPSASNPTVPGNYGNQISSPKRNENDNNSAPVGKVFSSNVPSNDSNSISSSKPHVSNVSIGDNGNIIQPAKPNNVTDSRTSCISAQDDGVCRNNDKQEERPTANMTNQNSSMPGKVTDAPLFAKSDSFADVRSVQPTKKIKNYVLPSVNLLVKRQDIGKLEQNQKAAEEKIPIINTAFSKLKIPAEVESYTIGPSVTRFNIKREDGVRVSQIANDDVVDEMKIDLKGDMSVRIEAVVRGQDTSGIEVANVAPTMVSFYDCFTAVLKAGPDKLLIPLGEDISCDVVTVSLDDMPHLLISGTTGSGKSVFIHSIIMTLIMRNYPSELKLILIDPKQVEFSRYRDMPHLYCPIISNIVQAVASLKKLVDEMERRYSILSRYECSKIQEYNQKRETQPDLEILPFLVCIIDEFADLMGQDPKNVDALTQRLAQKARAAGIYLLISTQRPSVKCITGTIKANIPARIALSLPTSTDSRTILDEGGAETLIGRGDLLARIPVLKSTIRLQSAFVSNDEISAVVHYLKDQAEPVYNPAFLNFTHDDAGLGNGGGNDESSDRRPSGLDDELYSEIKEYVMANNVASTSNLQRHFSIGYGRAASILDALEEEGIIKTAAGNRKEVVKHTDEINPQ